jgi:hypothetical protein
MISTRGKKGNDDTVADIGNERASEMQTDGHEKTDDDSRRR